MNVVLPRYECQSPPMGVNGADHRGVHPARRYATKWDTWIVLAIWVLPAGIFCGVIYDAWIRSAMPVQARVIALLVPLAYVAIIGLLAYPIYYELDGTHLRIRSGLLIRSTIDLASITLVRPTRNPLSSPAGSLDRLRIEYTGGKRKRTRAVMISPLEKQAFLNQLAELAPQAVIEGREQERPLS